MVKLPLRARAVLNKILHYAGIVLGTALLGAGMFTGFLSVFQLTYNVRTPFEGGFLEGLVLTWNQMADTVGMSRYLLWPQYSGAGESAETFLSVLLIGLLVLAFLIFRSRSLIIPGILAAGTVVGTFILGLSPGALPAALFLCGTALLAMYRNLGERMGASALGMTAAALAAALAIALVPGASDLISQPAGAADLTAKASLVVDHIRYGEDPLGNGDGITDTRQNNEETALVVEMPDPAPLYLRGFVGEIYSGGRWNALDNGEHYGSRALFRGLAGADFSALGQLADAAVLTQYGDADQTVTVKTEAASRKYAYVPYEINGTVSGTSSYSDAFLRNKGILGKKEYHYPVYGSLTGEWTYVTGELYSSPADAAFRTYSAAESHYNSWVYKHYTRLTDQVSMLLMQEIGSPGNQEKGHVDYKTAITRVQDYFSTMITYTSKTPAEPGVESLFRKHAGRDVEYAAAATLMFRYYGIPARYVEGYLLTSDNVDASGTTISVPCSDEHAWTEIYVDGVGFVPIEVCPEYYGVMPEADLEAGLDTKSNTNPFDQAVKSPEDSYQEEEPEPEAAPFPWKKILICIGIGLGALLLLVLLILGIRTALRARRREKAFRQPDVRQGIGAIYDTAVAKDLTLSPDAERIGREAVYSRHIMSEPQRLTMLAAYKEAAKQKRKFGRGNKTGHVSRKQAKTDLQFRPGGTGNGKKNSPRKAGPAAGLSGKLRKKSGEKDAAEQKKK